MSSLAPLILVVLAFGILLGLTKPRRIGKFAVGVLVGPLLIAIAFTAGREIFDSLPVTQKILFALLAGVGLLVLILRFALPRDVWAGVTADFIYDVLKFVVLLPFRILGFFVGLVARRGAR